VIGRSEDPDVRDKEFIDRVLALVTSYLAEQQNGTGVEHTAGHRRINRRRSGSRGSDHWVSEELRMSNPA
jgi:hypothetical protein